MKVFLSLELTNIEYICINHSIEAMSKKLSQGKEKVKRMIKFTDEYDVKEEIILRDHLALQRTKLANERTVLTYVRTALYLIIAGVAFLGMSDFESMRYVGYICLALSVMLLIFGFIRYGQLKRQLNKIYEEPLENKDH